MKLKTIKHQDGVRWAEIHTTPDTDAFVVRTFTPGKLTTEVEIPSSSLQDVINDITLTWAML